MTVIKVKGYEFAVAATNDSFDRRALQYKNKIITAFGRIGLSEDDVEIKVKPVAFKSAPASASWYLNGNYVHYSYKSARKYVENLYVGLKVIELEVDAWLAG